MTWSRYASRASTAARCWNRRTRNARSTSSAVPSKVSCCHWPGVLYAGPKIVVVRGRPVSRSSALGKTTRAQDANARAIGADPDARLQLVDHAARRDRVMHKDLGAGTADEANQLGPGSRVRLFAVATVFEQSDRRIGASELPRGVLGVERPLGSLPEPQRTPPTQVRRKSRRSSWSSGASLPRGFGRPPAAREFRSAIGNVPRRIATDQE